MKLLKERRHQRRQAVWGVVGAVLLLLAVALFTFRGVIYGFFLV